MDVLGVICDRLMTRDQAPLALKEAQIVQGKITKIYPQNKAEIQIGSHTLIAEVSTALSVGKRYFFQVQGTDQLIHLKVVGEPVKHDAMQTVQMLMDQLGLKQSKVNSRFIEQLIHDKIPFNQQQVEQGIRILEKVIDKQQTIQILKEMIEQKFPITEQSMQATQAQRTQTISQMLDEVMTVLQQKESLNETEQYLVKKLENVTVRPAFTGLDMMQQMLRANQSHDVFQIVKLLGIISPETSAADWEKGVALAKPNAPLPSSIFTQQAHTIEAGEMKQAFEQLLHHAADTQKTALKLVTIFHSLQDGKVTGDQYKLLENMIETELLQRLPAQAVHVIRDALQTNNQQQLYQILQGLSQSASYDTIANSLLPALQGKEESFVQLPMNEQFLTHLKTFLDTIGMDDEYVLRNHLEDVANQSQTEKSQTQSIKSMLLQLIQQEHGGAREQLQPMVHLINGMQMHSVVEVNQMMQATLQLPAEKLALHEDIYLQFEGHKTEDGQINSDYCRILFILHLHHLEETMIDMNVQKRVIAVTIFNDIKQTSDWDDSHVNDVLRDKLAQLNYQLSTVRWKPLHVEETAQVNTESSDRQMKQQKERYDFRI